MSRNDVIITVVLAVIIGGILGYAAGLRRLTLERSLYQTLVFPIGPVPLEYVINITKEAGVTLTHYVKADATGGPEGAVIVVDGQLGLPPSSPIAVFVVRGYLPQRPKLSLLYVVPELTTEEIGALVQVGRRQ